MAITYDKLLNLLQEKGYNAYRIKKEKLIGQATYYAIKNGTGGLDYRSLNRLCKALQCQPGDLMEYVADEDTEENDDQFVGNKILENTQFRILRKLIVHILNSIIY